MKSQNPTHAITLRTNVYAAGTVATADLPPFDTLPSENRRAALLRAAVALAEWKLGCAVGAELYETKPYANAMEESRVFKFLVWPLDTPSNPQMMVTVFNRVGHNLSTLRLDTEVNTTEPKSLED